MVRLHLADTLFSVIIAHTTLCLPFCLWLLRGFFSNLPIDLEEAAMIDGASRLGALLRVVIPLSSPAIVTTAMFAFVISWNEFLFALCLLTSDAKKTISVGAAQYIQMGVLEVFWGEMMAVSMIYAIPVFIFFVFLQKYLVKGLTAGAVKG
jgi:ABC-type glycerol-3-phosphate transport system permease component